MCSETSFAVTRVMFQPPARVAWTLLSISVQFQLPPLHCSLLLIGYVSWIAMHREQAAFFSPHRPV